jgi:3-hydroxyacyl-[acyl-carrier-protein] dehydratase
MRFHLIDKVEEHEPEKFLRAKKLTSHSEDYWEDRPTGLTMPEPFALEALCQAGTWLVMMTTERRKRAALLSVGSVAFLAEVHPGETLEMHCTVDSWSEDVAVISGRVTSAEKTVLEASEIMCTLIPAENLADLDTTERLQQELFRTGGGLA